MSPTNFYARRHVNGMDSLRYIVLKTLKIKSFFLLSMRRSFVTAITAAGLAGVLAEFWLRSYRYTWDKQLLEDYVTTTCPLLYLS